MKKDKETILTIENKGESFIYQNEGCKVTFTGKDIKKVILHLSPPLYEKRFTWLYWDDYFYSEIFTEKETFKISCLVIDNIEEYIPEGKLERRKDFFPLINNSKTPDIVYSELSRVEKLKLNFKNKTTSELEGILTSKNKYEKDAILAAEELLKERIS